MEHYIERMAYSSIERAFNKNRIVIIIGSRQVGKTTLMKVYAEGLKGREKHFYFNLEDINMLEVCQNIDSLFHLHS